MLKGLKEEIQKVDNLLDYGFLKKNILLPAIDFALEREYITNIEYNMLKEVVASNKAIQARNLTPLFPGKMDAEISRQIKRLIDENMPQREKDKSRKYVIRFDNNYLLRGVINMLGEHGFLPENEIT